MQQPAKTLTGEDVRKLLEPAKTLAFTGHRLSAEPNAPRVMKAEITDMKVLQKYLDHFDKTVTLHHLSLKPSAARYTIVNYKEGKISIVHVGRHIGVTIDGVLYTGSLKDNKFYEFVVEQVKANGQPSK